MQNASRPLVAAACAGVGAAGMLGLRTLLPLQLDVFGQHAAERSFVVTSLVLAVCLGAALGIAATVLKTRLGAMVLSGFVLAPAVWAVLLAVAVRQSSQSALSSGQALTAGLLMSPVYVVVAAMTLFGAVALGAGTAFVLHPLARRLEAASRAVQLAALSSWVAAIGLVPTTMPDAASAPNVNAVVNVPLPPVPACDASPFAAVARDANLRGPLRRIDAEHVFEFTVIGPSAWTDSELSSAVGALTTNTPPCVLDGAEWHARFVVATSLPLTLRLHARPRKGEDPMLFEAMLRSHLGSAFDSSLHVTSEGFFATSVSSGLQLFPPGVPREFTCEGVDADVRCTPELIEVRRPGVVPRLGALKLEP